MLRIILSRSKAMEVVLSEDWRESLGGRDFRWAKDERDKDVALEAGVDEVVPVPDIWSNTMLDLDSGAWSLHKLLEGFLSAAAGGSGQKGFKEFTGSVERATIESFEWIGFFPTSMAAAHFHEQLCRSGGVECG